MIKKLFAALMAMAMVVSVAPAKAALTGPTVCTKDEKWVETVADYVDALAEVVDLETVKLTDKFDFSGGKEITIEDVLDLSSSWGHPDGGSRSLQSTLTTLVNANCGTEEMAYLAGLVAGIDALETEVEDLEAKLIVKNEDYLTQYTTDADGDLIAVTATADGIWADEIANDTQYTAAKTLYAALTDDEELYFGNISENHEAALDAYLGELEERIDEYRENNYDTILDDYVEELLAVVLYGTTTVEDFLDDDGVVEYTKLKTFKETVEKITEDKVPALKAIALFEDVEDEEDVYEIIEALEEAIEGMEEVKELVKTKNAAYKAFTKADAQDVIDDLAAAAGLDANDNDVDDFYEALKDVKTNEVEVIADYYEEVVSYFYKITVKQRANGKYTVSNADTELVKYLPAAKATEYANVLGGLAKLLDKEEETTYYDELIALPEAVEEALAAISTDLKGVTVKNLNTKNAQKVVDAYDALGELKTTYAGNLTNAQSKVVKANDTNVTTLRTYMLFNGIQTVEPNGWVELDNGNWDYYVEGVAHTGWVAAGTNWYYVSNGHMLRNTWIAKDATGAVWYYVGNDGAMVANTVVDGYAINANGEWVK